MADTADLLIGTFSADDDNLLPGDDLRGLLVSLLDLRPEVSVLDFAAWSGSVLEGVLQAAERKAMPVRVEGQWINPLGRSIAKLVAALRGTDRMTMHGGDALFEPLCDAAGRLRRFDRVIAIPPFGLRDTVARLASDPFHRFSYGTPHRAAIDLAYLQHGLATLQPGGKAVVLLPASAMTRSGAERDIRAALFQDDRIDTLVALPAGLFPNAPRVETIAVVMHQQRDPARRGRVLLARGRGERRGRRLELSNVPELVRVCASWEQVPGVSRILTLAELAASDFVVSAARHLETAHAAAPVDVTALRSRLRENERIAAQAARELDASLSLVPGWEVEQ